MNLKLIKNQNSEAIEEIDFKNYKREFEQAEKNDWEKLAGEVALTMIPKLDRNVIHEASDISAEIWSMLDKYGQQKTGGALKSLVKRDLLPLIRLEKGGSNHQRYMRM